MFAELLNTYIICLIYRCIVYYTIYLILYNGIDQCIHVLLVNTYIIR